MDWQTFKIEFLSAIFEHLLSQKAHIFCTVAFFHIHFPWLFRHIIITAQSETFVNELRNNLDIQALIFKAIFVLPSLIFEVEHADNTNFQYLQHKFPNTLFLTDTGHLIP